MQPTSAGDLPDYAAGYDSSQDGHYDRGRPWAAERPKKFLAAQIAVGTVDHAMPGALKVRNDQLRSSGLTRNLLVVDEVHAPSFRRKPESGNPSGKRCSSARQRQNPPVSRE